MSNPDHLPGLRPSGPTTPNDLWAAARALDPTGDREWTFPLFVLRALALRVEEGREMNRGFDLCYEPVLSWEDVLSTLGLRDVLYDAGYATNEVPEINLGLEVFDSIFQAPGGRLSLPADDQPYRGRHSVGYLDIVDGNEIRFVNSWGPEWGDGGAGYISRKYFEQHCDSAWLSRASWMGPSPKMEPELRKLLWRNGRPGQARWADAAAVWRSINRPIRKDIRVGLAQFEVRCRSLYSVAGDCCPLQIVDFRNDEGIAGRCHILHTTSGVSVLQEFFVAPSRRRCGVGRAMEEVAVELSHRQGSQFLDAWFHEADAHPPDVPGGRAFAAERGYVFRPADLRRPNLIGIARKEL